jgi:hypothetical protein
MSVLEIVVTIIGIGGTASSIIFAYLAFRRNDKHESKDSGKSEGIILTEIGYIKSSIDRIEKRLDASDEKYMGIASRVSKVEESVSQAHKRIDDLSNSRKRRSQENE